MVRAKLCGCVRQRVSKRWVGQVFPTIRKGLYGTFIKTRTNDNQVNPSARMNSCESVYIRMSQWFTVSMWSRSEAVSDNANQCGQAWRRMHQNESMWDRVRQQWISVNHPVKVSANQCESKWRNQSGSMWPKPPLTILLSQLYDCIPWNISIWMLHARNGKTFHG